MKLKVLPLRLRCTERETVAVGPKHVFRGVHIYKHVSSRVDIDTNIPPIFSSLEGGALEFSKSVTSLSSHFVS